MRHIGYGWRVADGGVPMRSPTVRELQADLAVRVKAITKRRELEPTAAVHLSWRSKDAIGAAVRECLVPVKARSAIGAALAARKS